MPPSTPSSSPFHEGEAAVHARFGLRERIEAVGRQIIRDWMPDQHRELFEKLPALWVGHLDEQGRPWACVLVGRPGFIRSPDARTLRVCARPMAGDPLADQLHPGQPLGLLGLEASTRRRNRMNGTLVAVDGSGFTVEVDQSFGNCPQYIQARDPHWVDDAAVPPPARQGGPDLPPAALALIEQADTFFIASASPRARGQGGADGVDISHRGGRPGFVRHQTVAGASVLTVPDFRGNFLFNTLGNLMIHPHAGLIFTDPVEGHVLQLAGTTDVVWDGPEVQAYPGAQRLWRVRVARWRWQEAALPLRWPGPPRLAAQLAGTGPWQGPA